jgi:serine/threonine protein kinase
MSFPFETPRKVDGAGESPPTTPPSSGSTEIPVTQAQSDMPLISVGREIVSGYRLVRRLGSGGFGEVWEATAPGGYRVALKVLRFDQQAGQVEIKHLQHLKDIHHAHLLPVFGAWEIGGYLLLAMELADGTLSDHLKKHRTAGLQGIPTSDLLDLMYDAARGIDYLNEKGIIHRDVKPANLLLVGGSVKVADFGLAKLIDQSIAANSSGFTMAYAAPELFNSKLSSSVDQYALAVSYCELRGGRLPYEGTPHEVMFGHAAGTPNLNMLPEPEAAIIERGLSSRRGIGGATVGRWCTRYCRWFRPCRRSARHDRCRSGRLRSRYRGNRRPKYQ